MMECRALGPSYAVLWSLLFCTTARSLELAVDLPQSIRHNVEEFIVVTTFEASSGEVISFNLTITSTDENRFIFYMREILHTFANDTDIIQIPFRLAPVVENCSRYHQIESNILCSAAISIKATGRNLLVWEGNVEANIVKTPGRIYIQTSRETYSPGDEVLVRLLALDHELLPLKRKAHVSLLSPIVGDCRLLIWERNITFRKQPYVRKIHTLPEDALSGQWMIVSSFSSASVEHAKEEKFFTVTHAHGTSLFKVSVFHETGNFILPRDDNFTLRVSARTAFDEPVDGMAYITFGFVESARDSIPTFTHMLKGLRLRQGQVIPTVPLSQIVQDRDWTELNGKRLVIISSVTELNSGETQTVREESISFTDKPYIITFIRNINLFQPGSIVTAIVEIKYPNGSAVQIPVNLRFTATIPGREDADFQDIMTQTSDLGRAMAVAEIPAWSRTLNIVASASYTGHNGERYLMEKTEILHAKQDDVNMEHVYIVYPQEILQVGTNTVIQIFGNPSPIQKKIHYTVMKRGTLLMTGGVTMHAGDSNVLIELPVLSKMSPSIVLTAYYFAHESHNLVSDRVVIQIANICPGRKPAINPILTEGEMPTSGGQVDFVVTGEPTSVISLTGTDAAEESKIQELVRDADVGYRHHSNGICNEGRIFVGTFVRNPQDGCISGGTRTKRSITRSAEGFQQPDMFECCLVGTHDLSLVSGNTASCEDRKISSKDPSCARTFLQCCNFAECLRRFGLHSNLCDQYVLEGEIITERSISGSVQPFTQSMRILPVLGKNFAFRRKYMSPTWLFFQFKMNTSGTKLLDAESNPQIPVLPDRITMWNIDVFSISPDSPICFGDQLQLPVEHYVYIRVRLTRDPIIEGTLIAGEIVIYNHLRTTIQTYLYLRGDENICGGSNFGQDALPMTNILGPSRNSVPTNTRNVFSLLPLRHGKLKVKIKFVWTRPEDERKNIHEVIETLNVVPTGTRKREVKWILEDSSRQAYSIRTSSRKTKSVPIADDAIPGSTMVGLSVHSLAAASLMLPDLSTIDSTTIDFRLYQLYPNLLRLEYLETVGQNETNETDWLLENIRRSYVNLLGYLRPITTASNQSPQRFAFSYSPGERSPSSLKLTSSTLNILFLASTKVNIDATPLRGCIYWILDQQNRRGYFKEKAKVLDNKKSAKGIKVKSSRNSKASTRMSKIESKIYITGNVLKNLASIWKIIKAVSFTRKETFEADLEAIWRAIKSASSYLKRRTKKLAQNSKCRNLPALTSAAHALQLIQDEIGTKILSGIKRWKGESSNDAGVVWWIKSCKSRGLTAHFEADAYSTESTADMLSVGILKGFQPDFYANWLISNRNTGNYWTSLHASLKAMESLGKYALFYRRQDSTDIKIECQNNGSNSSGSVGESVSLSCPQNEVLYPATGGRKTWLKISSSYYSPAPKADVEGEGVDMEHLHCIYIYNVAIIDQPSMGIGSRSARDRVTWVVSISVSLIEEAISGGQYESYVLDFTLPPGSNVVKSDLGKLFNPVEYIIDHYRITGSSIQFYMTGNKNISFRITHTYIQRGPIPIKIYPVSSPQLSCVKFYNFPGRPVRLQIFCSGDDANFEEVCVCANGKACPQYIKTKQSTRITVDSRIIKACHDESAFAYKVYLSRRKEVDNVWFVYKGEIREIYRADSTQGLRSDIAHMFWMKRSCGKISVNRNYLIIGKTVLASRDGVYKHLIDNNAWLEYWPDPPDICGRSPSKVCDSSEKLDEFEYKMKRFICNRHDEEE